jgi:hypothetical protein
MGVKRGFAGMGGGGAEGEGGEVPLSKTQAKREKRGDRMKRGRA